MYSLNIIYYNKTLKSLIIYPSTVTARKINLFYN